MDLEAIRQFLHEHPDGVKIRMVTGKEYLIPHRDYIWLGPPRTTPESRKSMHRTSFVVHEPPELEMRLVNAMLVAEILPWHAKNGNGHGKAKGKKKG